MVVLAGLVTYWKKYFGHNKVRKRSRTDVFKTGSNKYPSYEGYEPKTSTVKINAQGVSGASSDATIEDLRRTMKRQHDELNEKFADLDTKILTIRRDMEKDGKAKNITN